MNQLAPVKIDFKMVRDSRNDPTSRLLHPMEVALVWFELAFVLIPYCFRMPSPGKNWRLMQCLVANGLDLPHRFIECGFAF